MWPAADADIDRTAVPPGYRRVPAPSGTVALARDSDADAIATILAADSLYEWSSRQPDRRPMQGRGVAWAVKLPSSTRVVVRHSRHGGLLASITGDRFLPPTRAPHELAAALWLTGEGIPTPAIIAYAVYPAGPLLRRSDVAVEEIPESSDLGELAGRGGVPLDAAFVATSNLLRQLGRAGALHPDLNLKNVLLSGNPARPKAWVLDVDRIRRTDSARAMRGNVERFLRSLRKWRDQKRAAITDEQIARISALAGGR